MNALRIILVCVMLLLFGCRSLDKIPPFLKPTIEPGSIADKARTTIASLVSPDPTKLIIAAAAIVLVVAVTKYLRRKQG